MGGFGGRARPTEEETRPTKAEEPLAEIRHALAQAVQVADGGHVRPAVVGPGRGRGGGAARRLWFKETSRVRRSRATRRDEGYYFVKSQGVKKKWDALRADGCRGEGRRALRWKVVAGRWLFR